MLMAILLGLLAAVVIYWAIIAFGKLLSFLQKKINEHKSEVAVGDVGDLIAKAMNDALNRGHAQSIRDLRKKAGKKGMFVASVKDGKVDKETITLIRSDQRDQETEDALREADGLLYCSA